MLRQNFKFLTNIELKLKKWDKNWVGLVGLSFLPCNIVFQILSVHFLNLFCSAKEYKNLSDESIFKKNSDIINVQWHHVNEIKNWSLNKTYLLFSTFISNTILGTIMTCIVGSIGDVNYAIYFECNPINLLLKN